ncbi:feruloyl esterase B [Astrocystis sublimbata]|nr:feruloyl esterase B [Astrocystis sublimbata]
MTRVLWTLGAACWLVVTTASAIDFKTKCLQFQPQDLAQNATLNHLEYVSANTSLSFPDNVPSCGRASQAVAVDLCRVAMTVPTSQRSGFTFELWLPETWNGRTLATGNGGLDGCVKYEDVAYGAANGFASFGTNNGHDGGSGEAFYQNDDVVIDFSWRALHTSVELGKELASNFFDKAPGKSYYIGCSLGGRQGIGNAEKFPSDFDGIVAGAPAVDFNSLYSFRASFFTITGSSASPDFISGNTWKTTIHDEVMRQCDDIDGVKDGIIEDPVLCHFDAAQLLCKDNATSSTSISGGCLTAAQVDIAKRIYGDYTWPNGTLLYPRVNPGGENLASSGLYSGNAYGPSADWFKYAVLGQPSWDPATYTTDDAALAIGKNPGDIATWSSSQTLSAFKDKGGKILSYHGQQDQQISSLNSIRFWKRLAGDAGEAGGDLEKMDAFYRLFRIPGMDHCGGGPGAWTVGQSGTAPSYSIPFDKEHNVLAAIVDWVEKGEAPDEIVGTKFIEDSAEKGVSYLHRHCRYPFRSTYSGSGDPLDMGSWHCVNFGGY